MSNIQTPDQTTEIDLSRGTAEYDARGAQQYAEELEAIEAEEVSERQQTAMNAAIECGSYTATALVAMAQWLFEMGDAKGSEMVTRFAAEFARHEAVTL